MASSRRINQNQKNWTPLAVIKKCITKVALDKIVLFLQNLKNVYTKNTKRIQKFIKAVVWMARTGAQWRALPNKYGDWNSVFRRFNEWSKKGIWVLLQQHCITDPDLESVMIDSTVVRAHACSAGYKKGQQEAQALLKVEVVLVPKFIR